MDPLRRIADIAGAIVGTALIAFVLLLIMATVANGQEVQHYMSEIECDAAGLCQRTNLLFSSDGSVVRVIEFGTEDRIELRVGFGGMAVESPFENIQSLCFTTDEIIAEPADPEVLAELGAAYGLSFCYQYLESSDSFLLINMNRSEENPELHLEGMLRPCGESHAITPPERSYGT